MKTTNHISTNSQPHQTAFKLSIVSKVFFCLCLVLLQFYLFGKICFKEDGDAKKNMSELNNSYSDWKVVLINSEIEVYERWVYLPEKRKTRERKGVFYVTNEIEEIVEMTTQADRVKLWMSGVTESKDLYSTSLDHRIMYILFQVPWPFSDKDLVAEITVSANSLLQCVTIKYSAVSDFLPLNAKAERLLSYEANWTITRMESDLTQVEFKVFSDTPPVAPRWIQDPITIKLFKKNLLKLRELLIKIDNKKLNAMNE